MAGVNDARGTVVEEDAALSSSGIGTNGVGITSGAGLPSRTSTALTLRAISNQGFESLSSESTVF